MTPTRSKAVAASAVRDTNEVTLTGRIGAVTVRELPDGSSLVTFRVIVSNGSGRYDTVDCASTRKSVIAKAERLERDTRVQINGALRRSFWRAGPTVASRTSVDVSALSRVRG